jgi:hypothetical protein
MGLLLTAAALVAVYVYFATAGTFAPQQIRGAGTYDMLGRAFLAGQLHLLVEPSPELLALPDPYDPRARAAIPNSYLFDSSLYKGRYYLYWGPAPAFYHAAWRVLTGEALREDIAQVAAAAVSAVAFFAIVFRLRARYFPAAPRWSAWLPALAFAFGGLMLHLVGRPSVYHEAQQAAMAFLLPGLYALLVAPDVAGWRRLGLLGICGLLLGFAAASRITYAGASFGPAIVLAAAVVQATPRARRAALADLASFGIPVGMIAAILLLYNYLRFDSPFEFGILLSLHGSTWFADHVVNGPNGHTFNTIGAIWVNLPVYFFSIPNAQWHYPWFPYNGPFLRWPSLEQDQVLVVPPMAPVWLVAPASLLAFAWPLPVFRQVPPVARSYGSMLLIGGLASLTLLLTSRIAEMRYLADVLPMLSILAALVVMQVAIRVRSRRVRRGILTAAVAGWAVSLAFGPLAGFGAWQWESEPSASWMASVADPPADTMIDDATALLARATLPVAVALRPLTGLIDDPPEQRVADARAEVAALRSRVLDLRGETEKQRPLLDPEQARAVEPVHAQADQMHADADRFRVDADSLQAQAQEDGQIARGPLLLLEQNRLTSEADRLRSEIDLLQQETEEAATT